MFHGVIQKIKVEQFLDMVLRLGINEKLHFPCVSPYFND